ncbi:MAG: hypothetical protein WBD34_20390 [Burkholderiaceae bacterium]
MAEHPGYALILSGAILFFVGLLQGVGIPYFKNSRMALSGHLTAVQCAMALMIFGLMWSHIGQALGHALSVTAQLSLIVGFLLIWIGITAASINGASKTLPIAGAGFSGSKAAESLVTVVEVIGSLLAVIGGGLVVWGADRNFKGHLQSIRMWVPGGRSCKKQTKPAQLAGQN